MVLSNPEAVADVYATQLNISRATYFYQLKDLVPALVQALNHWEVNQAAQPAIAPENLPPLQSNLPVPLTSLVGVEPVLQSLTQLILRDNVRLVTLLGPGGIGKTRLSIEISRRLAEKYGNDLCFVDLAAISAAEKVGEAISQALGIKQGALANIKDYLRPREFLLILDNFEQVLNASSLVTDLLATAPRLKVLVTSRSALRVYGEHEFSVPALIVPDVHQSADTSTWAQTPAVGLFVQRAQEVNTHFALSAENVEAVAELCYRMEGIPLAIELAAFQVKYFSPQAILVRLANGQRLNFLSQVPKQLPAHQQTLRAMLDWSYVLLTPPLQALFARLGVFAAGFSMDAALAVCGQSFDPQDVLAGVTALADQSLLEQTCDAAGEPRFRMLGLFREYALEQLELLDETSQVMAAHAAYYLQLAELDARRKDPASRETVFACLRREYANIKAGIQWAIDHREGEMGLRFINALWDYWKCVGDIRKGKQFAQAVLEQTSGLNLPIRARVLRLDGWLAHDVRDFTTMAWAFQTSLDLSEKLNDDHGRGLALQGLGELAQLRGQTAQARGFIEKALVIFEAHDNKKHMGWSFDLLGGIELGKGNLQNAQLHFENALQLFREVCSNSGTSMALVHLGQSLLYQGCYQQACVCFEKCLDECQAAGKTNSSTYILAMNFLSEGAAFQSRMRSANELNDTSLQMSQAAGYTWCTEMANFTAGLMAFRAKELESAAFNFRQSLVLLQSLQEGWRSLLLLETSASLAAVRGEWLGSARLYGAADALRKKFGIQPIPIYRPDYEAGLHILGQEIDMTSFAEAQAAGRELQLNQALAYAIRCLE